MRHQALISIKYRYVKLAFTFFGIKKHTVHKILACPIGCPRGSDFHPFYIFMKKYLAKYQYCKSTKQGKNSANSLKIEN